MTSNLARPLATIRRSAIAIALLSGLSACESGGPSLFQGIGELTNVLISDVEPVPAPSPTRAELDQIPFPVISVSIAGGPVAYLIPAANNRGYLDFRDAEGNSVRLFGGAIAGIDAPGYDLDGVRHGTDDPIAHPRAIADWPAALWREYQFSVRDLDAYGISLNCEFEKLGQETIEIVERRHNVFRVAEVCTNARRQVINTYWVDEATGAVWKSEQWAGPKLGHVTIEVIRPVGT